MKKKNLEKAIILGLILSTGVYGTAWAEEAIGSPSIDEKGNKILTFKDQNIVVSNNSHYEKFKNYDKIVIDKTMNEPSSHKAPGLSIENWYINIPSVDFDIIVNGTKSAAHGIYLTGGIDYIDSYEESNKYFVIGDYNAVINNPNSDAFHFSADMSTEVNGGLETEINNFTANVANGNGIIVGASTNDIMIDEKSSLTVNEKTDITINGDKVVLNDHINNYEISNWGHIRPFKTEYNPAGIYAGNTTANFYWTGVTAIDDFDREWPNYAEGQYGEKTEGKGVINLIGDTKITINDEENNEKAYGLYAGKNGEINVNNLIINANNKNSIGIAAQNGNLIFDGTMTVDIIQEFLGIDMKDVPINNSNLDTSANKYGSVVTMNGENNTITMAGGGKALYADAKNKDVDVIIQSGASGIGTLDVKGDIVAANSGKINLQVNDWADITGDIEATNSAEINFTLQPEAMMIVSDTDNNIIGNSGVSTLSLAKNGDAAGGNVQAANGATINFNLGNAAYFEGRVDDYKDADNTNWSTIDRNLFDSAFVTENIDENGKMTSGKVNMTLGNGAVWNVTEQSWVTNLSGNGTVVLVGEVNQNDENLDSNIYTEGTGGYAVHIGKLEGNNTFVVNLNPDNYASSDMIYIYDGSSAGVQNLRINNEQEVLNALQNDGDRIRFATAAKTATTEGAGFGDDYVVRGRGVINSGFSIDYVDYATDTDNGNYNGTAGAVKPGDEYIENTYGAVADSQNLYLVRDSSKDAGLSDSGKTVINMSRANYKNAVYMDRLNKRLGEARYFNNEEEQGMWVRLRHDRIGLDGEFRSQNTMYEMGYDVKQDCDNGERRVGMAIDYMDGSTSYSNIIGEGETKRYGLWLYDTWLGDKGHYTDYVLKWGHLDNDFDIRDKDSLVDITGDYSNNVFSASAEYGKKNDMGGGWYFEPQAQLQFARVTGADYVTSQDTKVSLDGINSLIGRAGFRLGRDLNENSTVYVKADLLHEFLGDQDITATDITGTLREEYENEGTWYDVGFGFATALGKSSYAFMDFEKSFGNDNDETYQINAGVQWTF